MPIFEFRCDPCARKFSDLVRSEAELGDVRCPHCGGQEIHKLVSKFMRLRSEDERLEEAVDRLEGLGDDEPGRVRAQMMEAGRALDDDMSSEMDELADADFSEETV